MSSALLNMAIQEAKSGQRQKAREIFLMVVKEDPRSYLAWVWLSDLFEQPEDRITALENALAIKPDQAAVRDRLEKLKQECAQPPRYQIVESYDGSNGASQIQPAAEPVVKADTHETERELYRQARQQVKEGQREKAVETLKELIRLNDQRVQAWQLLAEIHLTPAERIDAWEKVLALQPDHAEARSRLDVLKKVVDDPWALAAHYEETGDIESALAVYLSINIHSKSATERVQACRRMEELKLRQESDRLTPVNPTLNLARLTTGPVLFFALLIFIQAGLNPLKLGLLPFIGLIAVIAGSLLVTVTGLRPLHPRWVKMFGRPGSDHEVEMRGILRLLGWALLIAPFVLFFIEAGYRLVLLYQILPTLTNTLP